MSDPYWPDTTGLLVRSPVPWDGSPVLWKRSIYCNSFPCTLCLVGPVGPSLLGRTLDPMRPMGWALCSDLPVLWVWYPIEYLSLTPLTLVDRTDVTDDGPMGHEGRTMSDG